MGRIKILDRGRTPLISCVVDASIGLSWVIPSQTTPEASMLLEMAGSGTVLIVPPLWFIETANSLLLVQERRKKLITSERKKALTRLFELPLEVDNHEPKSALTAVSDLASSFNLTVYDAIYLEIALRKSIPLATRDESLKSAAIRAGILIFAAEREN